MKTSTYIFLIALVSFATISCQKELEQIPLTDKATNNFYSSESEVEAAVNAVYATLQFSGNYASMLAIGTISGEDVYEETAANDGGIYQEINIHSVLPQNSRIENAWQDSYKTIQRANITLNRMKDISFEKKEIKTAREGELKFLRAFAYFNLVRVFGDVPLILDEVEPLQSYGMPRKLVDGVYAQIEKDLGEAISVLPARTESNKNRVVKTAAQALLGKVKLTQKDYVSAKTQLEAVVSAGVHSLVPVADVFDVTKELNKEIIFAVQFASDVNGRSEGSDAYRLFNPSARESQGKGHGTVKKTFYDMYDNADARKGVYVGITAANIAYGNKFKKGVVIEDSPSDWVVLRYADILLMLAEIENNDGNFKKSEDYLNQVRNRANLPNVATQSDKNAMAGLIDIERRKELIWEGHRWFDLLRTERVNTVFPNVAKERHLLPLPSKELAADPSLTQNSGY